MFKISRESEINLVNVLIDNDIISGKDITLESAIIKSMYLLSMKLDFKNFKEMFELSISGEIS